MPKSVVHTFDPCTSKDMAALVTPALTITVPSPPRPAVVASSSSPSRQLFYAVRKGHQAGVYSSWQDAELQIKVRSLPRVG